jgi:hypothetical protein
MPARDAPDDAQLVPFDVFQIPGFPAVHPVVEFTICIVLSVFPEAVCIVQDVPEFVVLPMFPEESQPNAVAVPTMDTSRQAPVKYPIVPEAHDVPPLAVT